jgi:hypothetical protein
MQAKLSFRSNESILDIGSGAFGRQFALVHVSAGIVPAGAGTRFQNECFAVLSFDRDGTRRIATQYRTVDEARAHFERYTTPVVEIVA